MRPPLGVSKRSVVELRGKDQQIALASMAPSQVARKHDFVAKVVGGCSSYDVIAP